LKFVIRRGVAGPSTQRDVESNSTLEEYVVLWHVRYIVTEGGAMMARNIKTIDRDTTR
jgi:hypothetical protein